MTAADKIRRRAAETAASAETLDAVGVGAVAGAIAQAASALVDPDSDIGSEARPLLVESTGLSREMVDWALATTCGDVSADALEAFAAAADLTGAPSPSARAVPARARLAAIVLSGNVFTAPFRAVAVPLLAGVPVIAKASSRDDIFPRVLHRALEAAAPDVAASYAVLTFEGGDAHLEDALFAQADVVAAYGSDTTLGHIRGRLPATTTFVPHGHGLGAIWIPDEADDETVARVALDVAAYDQRGCLSPHGIWVRGDAARGRSFADRLARALETIRESLPRGLLPLDRGAQQLQWRGVAAARGDLFEGDGYAVSFEGDGPLRLSPGYRNVSVLSCASAEDLGHRLVPLGMHLKALGVAADGPARRALAAALPAPLAPRVSEVGTLQTPPLDSLADGHSPWFGLIRHTQVD
ncbi:MAG: hypothetical protein JRH11_08275 [Deltaproteobacteria bacterium]|nr:hypothetical protein [Deltaproteobacteria bacterium]